MPGLRRMDAAADAAPAGDGGRRRQAALDDLVPADQLALVRRQVLFHPLHQPRLQLRPAGQLVLFDGPLAVGTLEPPLRIHLVTANMDVGGGKQRHRLVQHILQEGEGAFLAGAHDIAAAGAGKPLGRAGEAEEEIGLALLLGIAGQQFGIGGDHRLGMAGHLDLGDDRDVTRGGVGDNRLDLVLRVETAITADRRLFAPGGDTGQLRIFLDLQPPAMAIDQMPVKDIELVHRHPVEPAPDLVGGLEMAGGIEHESAPAKARLVVDGEAGQGGLALKQLPQGLDAVEGPRRFACRDLDPGGIHGQPVTFRRQAVLFDQADGCRFFSGFPLIDFLTICGQRLGQRRGFSRERQGIQGQGC